MNSRRKFLQGAMALSAAPLVPKHLLQENKPATYKLKISLNAYSFNAPLRDGSMTIDDMLEFCSKTAIQAVDLTGYYFPGYPAAPKDEYIHHVKNKAFRLGLAISGTGVRNDFTDPDPAKRKSDIQMVKNWIVVASKLGAPVIRLFAGVQNPAGYSWEQVSDWMIKDFRECIEFGKNHGVIIGMQNHNDFIKTADHVHKIMAALQSDWFGLILDTGSYRSGDPYQQIADTIKYAVNWQLKENIFVNGVEQPTDVDKVISIIKRSSYRGYLPIETLGPGDPKVKIPVFLDKVVKALG